jgi:hypothetical protein
VSTYKRPEPKEMVGYPEIYQFRESEGEEEAGTATDD